MAEARTKARERLKWLRRNNPEWNRNKNAKWKAANPEKFAAHKAVEYAVRIGTLVRQPCERCGATGLIHAHHDDYSRTLEVIWLCPVHHRERHRELDIMAGRLPQDHAPRKSGGPIWGAVPFRGVHKTSSGKFRAAIKINGRKINLGTFSSPQDAAAAYTAASFAKRAA
jgi:hypothetical protein